MNLDERKAIKLGDYKVYVNEPILGEGKFGKVYKGSLVSDRTKQFAIKKGIIFPENEHLFDREEQSLMKLSHKNIIKCFDVMITNNNAYYFILEYCEDGTLQNYLNMAPNKKLPEAQAIEIMKQLVSGVVYAHENNVIINKYH